MQFPTQFGTGRLKIFFFLNNSKEKFPIINCKVEKVGKDPKKDPNFHPGGQPNPNSG
jgi:hypothetical protein